MTFSLCSSECIHVFSFGSPRISDGETITVHGTFAAVKHTIRLRRYGFTPMVPGPTLGPWKRSRSASGGLRQGGPDLVRQPNGNRARSHTKKSPLNKGKFLGMAGNRTRYRGFQPIPSVTE